MNHNLELRAPVVESASVSGLIRRVIEILCQWTGRLAGVFLVFITALIAVNVLGRYVFRLPVTGADEMLSLALLGLAFLTFGQVEMEGRHIRVTIITGYLPARAKLLFDLASSLLNTGIMVLMGFKTVRLSQNFWADQNTSMVMGIPLFLITIVMAWGALISALSFVVSLTGQLKKLLKEANRSLPWLILAIGLPLLLLSLPFWDKNLPWALTKLETGIAGISLMLILLFLGPPVGTVLLLVGYLGTSYIGNINVGLSVLAQVSYSTATTYGWIVLPLFMFMGNLVFEAGLGQDIYRTAAAWLGHLPGGLAMATVGGCAGFAAACGDSLATAATLCRIALPEMRRFNYDIALATGALAAGGTLGILIPPSLGFIIYGMITEQSIGKLFIAGIIPGIMLASLFNLMIYLRARRNPKIAPPIAKATWPERIISLKGTLGIMSLFLIVIGGIYAGLFTATEGAGIGAVGAFAAAIIKRRFNRQGFLEAVRSAVLMNGSIFHILIGAMVFSYFVTICKLPFALADLISSLTLNRYLILIIIMLIYIALGCIMNIMPAVIITLPMIFPTVTNLGFDPIWFGVMMVINMEMGQITPPVGINVYTICSIVPDVSMGTVFRGVMPFFVMMCLMLLILTLLPSLATFLPNFLMGK